MVMWVLFTLTVLRQRKHFKILNAIICYYYYYYLQLKLIIMATSNGELDTMSDEDMEVTEGMDMASKF